jgi:hypothetical protein
MSAETTWTWVLFAFEVIGITGTFFVGRKYWWGWLIILLHSIPWFIYSSIYGKPGFIAMSFMWWGMNFYNMMRWREQSRVERDLTLSE